MQLFISLTESDTREYLVPKGMFIEIALGAEFLLDQGILHAGCFQVGLRRETLRTIRYKKNQTGMLVSILLDERNEFPLSTAFPKQSPVSPQAYYWLLSVVNPPTQVSNKLLTVLIHELLSTTGETPCPVSFNSLQKVFLYVQQTETLTTNVLKNLPRPDLDKKRFQLGCRFLYGKPFKKLLQEIRLRKAMYSLLYHSDPIPLIQENAGYLQESSFKKAFKKKFMILPATVRTYAAH